MNTLTNSFLVLCLFIGFSSLALLAQPRPQNVVIAPGTEPKKEVLTNTSVIELAQLGLGDAILLEKIRQSECIFDTSINGLKQLKAAKVSETVIAAMMNVVAKPAPQTTTTPLLTAPTSLSTDPTQRLITPELDKAFRANPNPQKIIMMVRGEDGKAGYYLSGGVLTLTGKVKNEALKSVEDDSKSGKPVPAVIGGMGGGLANTLAKELPLFPLLKNQMLGALRGASSKAMLGPRFPERMELWFADIDGADPAEFAPVLLRLTPTKNNYRLVYSKRDKVGETSFDFYEDRVPVKIEKIGVGHFAIFLEESLPAGEYAIVIRPVPKLKPIGTDEVVPRVGEVMLIVPIWDFRKK